MSEVKVSVIIPVYNVEQYISECVISLLKQDLLDSEFIFINDGSLDSSIEILKQYKKRIIAIDAGKIIEDTKKDVKRDCYEDII